MYSDVFCKVYNELGWNYYPEAFGEQLIDWMEEIGFFPRSSLDMGCGTGVLCEILHKQGIRASGMDLSPGMIEIARASCPRIHYDVADMTTYRPAENVDLVTCTGDALNHIPEISDVEKIFCNVFTGLNPGGYYVFDILNPGEVSGSEPFELDFSDELKVWFQMTLPEKNKVNLQIRVFENGVLSFEENIRETIHDAARIVRMLERVGFTQVSCADRLLPRHNGGTTWFISARKPNT